MGQRTSNRHRLSIKDEMLSGPGELFSGSFANSSSIKSFEKLISERDALVLKARHRGKLPLGSVENTLPKKSANRLADSCFCVESMPLLFHIIGDNTFDNILLLTNL